MLRALQALSIFSLCLFGGSCANEIGDECNSDAECGQGRRCDRASRAGYCTITPCEPGTCPENSVCVEFENTETWCMGVCGGDGDCRKGYRCDKETGAVPFCRQEG